MSSVDVRVSKRVLWVGEAAYPLQNITRVRTVLVKKQMNRGLAGCLGYTVTSLASWSVLVILGAITNTTGTLDAALLLAAIGAVVAAVAVGSKARRRRKSSYLLEIVTSGSQEPFGVLASADKESLDRVVHEILQAIDHPETEFQMRVENLHVGDNISMFGSHNTGKMG